MTPSRWLAATGAIAAAFGAVVTPGSAYAEDESPAFSMTKTVTRDVLGADGQVETIDEREVTVTADVIEDLRGRQVMTVRWSGAHPSGGIVGNVYSLEAWTATEYPVVVLQCRGDDSSADPADWVTPETCWTTYGSSERRWLGKDLYRHDMYSTEAQKVASIPEVGTEWDQWCSPELPGLEFRPKRIIPFIGADGTEYWRCGAEGQGYAPEMGTQTALGPNDKVEVTLPNGAGFTHFEMRTAAENASLGCSETEPCSVVVIPIMGLSCDSGSSQCSKEGLRPVGSQYSDQVPVSEAVTAQYWASESNWRNRITIPVTVAANDSVCKDTTGRTTLQLYGSALLSGAMEQWSPAYCGRDDRFVLRVNDQVEATAYGNLRSGYGSGVVATYKDDSATTALGYAPVAVTGFAIGFVIDIPNGGGQLENLKLTPRLLAKLLTASYWGGSFSSAAQAERPDLAGNPKSLQLDPEFRQLNPDLDEHSILWDSAVLSFSQLMGPSVPSDMMTALTSYIAADPEAVAFINGTPDPWGMIINSTYRGISLPRADWPLADSWVMPGSTGCDASQPIPWYSKVMAPVSDIHRLAQDLLAATPEAIYSHTIIPNTDVCKTARLPQLPQGSRAMLALVTLADAERYAIPTAALRTVGTGPDATFVTPTPASMNAAAQLMTQAAVGEPFVPDPMKLVASSTAYPGTMVVHAAIPLSGLDTTIAVAAASFITIATTEGQVRGSSTGELPAGYVPISSNGATAALYTSAQQVATAVAAQSGPMNQIPPNQTTTISNPVTGIDLTSNLIGLNDVVGTQVLAAGNPAVAVPGLPATEQIDTATGSLGLTPGSFVGTPLRSVIPGGLTLATLAGIAIPILLRTKRVRS